MRRAVLAAAVLAAACAGLPAGPARAAGDAAQGKALAAERNCATCHGAAGVSATPNIPSLAGQPEDFITLQMILFRERLRDAPPMPDMAQGLEDPQIEALAAHYAGLAPGHAADRAPRDEARYQAGAALSEKLRCGICHLPDYRGRAQIPRITGQREEYLAQSLTQYRDGKRHGSDTNMNAVVYGVPDADLAALAHYLAQQ
ncbi:c-type cytochrome [Paeniroseomonas aquatica]|uniref:C-type cytochrome n=1 Tax=Paeniroseomonas aquatica TaxID=373043 RepID=A0ABT8A9V7_9PROT|nr:c-type cytochrome [Paeniroseomonas aquatica]MDN3566206.1 c-type cytochrome [Paeniroseomonas aquatica]